MRPNDKSADLDVALGAASEGLAAARASLAVVGRYWWNLQMRLLTATGTMRLFRSQWWLFLVLGFALLAFVLPLGVAFVVSAFCAGEMKPKAENNYLVPLRHDNDPAASVHPQAEHQPYFEGPAQPDMLEDVRTAACLHHVGYLRAIGRDVDDAEFAAAALGALDGTLQAFRVKLTDLDMHTEGAALVARQLKDLGRMPEPDPARIAELTAMAMSSEALEGIRVEAGRFSYQTEGQWGGAMRHGPA